MRNIIEFCYWCEDWHDGVLHGQKPCPMCSAEHNTMYPCCVTCQFELQLGYPSTFIPPIDTAKKEQYLKDLVRKRKVKRSEEWKYQQNTKRE